MSKLMLEAGRQQLVGSFAMKSVAIFGSNRRTAFEPTHDHPHTRGLSVHRTTGRLSSARVAAVRSFVRSFVHVFVFAGLGSAF